MTNIEYISYFHYQNRFQIAVVSYIQFHSSNNHLEQLYNLDYYIYFHFHYQRFVVLHGIFIII